MSSELRSRLRSLPSFPGTLPSFDRDAAPAEPEPLFLAWLEEAVAAGVLAPHAATLATVDASSVPSARVLILKDLDAEGWAIATPADRRPGIELAASGHAALSFFWPALGRQVRVEGEVQRASDAESAADFRERPAAANANLDPGAWALWRIVPGAVEFWQASHDRAHVRLRYLREGEGWRQERPQP